MIKRIAPLNIIFGVFLFKGAAFAVALSSNDSLLCEVSGGAALSFLHGAGAKASEDGLLIASLTHAFTDRIGAVCAIRAGSDNTLPLLEKGAIKWQSGQSAIEAGFVSHRYGFDQLYRPHCVFNFLFDKPVLWDAYGFGVTYDQGIFSRFSVTAASSINAKENGQAHILFRLRQGAVEPSLLCGFQSYTIENQDNSFTAGFNTQGTWDAFRVHATAKYVTYFGYGHNANSTMTPGNSTTAFLELSYAPASPFQVSGISYYTRTHKRFDHEFYFEGMEATWMILRCMGFGTGCDWQKDDDVNELTPRLFITAVPYPGAAEVRVSCESTYLQRSIISYRLTGEIWIRI